MFHLKERSHPLLTLALTLALGLALPQHARAVDEFNSGLRNAGSIDEPTARERVEQIDNHNGNLMVRHVDLRWKGNGGLELAVHRNYDLQGASAGLARAYSSSFRWNALGPGWTMMVAPRWVEHKAQQPSGSPVITDLTRLCNGTISPFNGVPDGAPAIELPEGGRELLIFVAPGRAVSKGNWQATCSANRITVKAPDGTAYDMGDIATAWRGQDGPAVTFELTYVLPAIQAIDPHGNSISYQYRKVGTSSPLSGLNPASIMASDGRAVTFTYDETTRKLLSMQDNTGRSWSYSYSDTGIPTSALASVTLPGQLTWRYSYSPGVLSGPDEASNAISSKLHTLTYPEGGSVTFEVEPFSYAWTGASMKEVKVKGERIRRSTMSTGDSWTYEYTKGGIGQYDTTVETGPLGIFTHKFMGFGYAVSPAVNAYVDNLWRVGLLIESSDNQGNSEVFTYAPREIYNQGVRLFGPELVWDSKIWAADLAQHTIVRNGASRTTKFSNFDAYGNPGTMTETGPSGETRTTTRTYYTDAARWIVKKVKDEFRPGQSTTRIFDAFGSLLSINVNGIVTSQTYDGQGNIASTTFPRGLTHTFANYKRGIAQSVSQPEAITITRVVNDIGKITSETNGEAHTTLYGYDDAGRVTSITPPGGTTTNITYSSNEKVKTRGALIERTSLDGFGRVASVVLGGIAHTYRYDALGRKIFASDADSASGTSSEYDTFNRVVRLIYADGSSQRTVYSGATKTVYDQRDFPTTYSYRSYGDPDEQYLMAISAPEAAASISFVRDERNLVSAVTQAGKTRSYGYNTSQQVVTVTNPETGITTFGRDEAGNMTTRTVGASGSTTYTYDGQNRLSAAVYPGATPSVTLSYTKTNKIKAVNSSAANHSYLYDPNDNLTSESVAVDGNTFTTAYAYNGNDQLSSITYPMSGRVINYAPDLLGRPTMVSGYVGSIAYWPSGMLKDVSYANGTVSSYTQHARLWPASFSTQRGAVSYMNSIYSYDGVGNMTSITDSVESSNSRTMGFDKINRLTSITGPWGAGSIDYDGNGNITSQVLGAQGLYYAYDGASRLASVSGSRVTSYAYDAYGNIASGSARTFTYDGVPNLRCVNCADSALKIEYTYDGMNQRIAVNKGGAKTYEIYGTHGNQLMSYTPGSNPKLVEYIYLGGKRIAQRVGL